MKGRRVWLAWLVVGIPLAWGVSRSVQKSLPLFGVGSTPAPAPPAAMPTTTSPRLRTPGH